MQYQYIKWRSRRLRPKAHILDDPLGNPYDVLKVLVGPLYGPYGPLILQKNYVSSSRKIMLT